MTDPATRAALVEHCAAFDQARLAELFRRPRACSTVKRASGRGCSMRGAAGPMTLPTIRTWAASWATSPIWQAVSP